MPSFDSSDRHVWSDLRTLSSDVGCFVAGSPGSWELNFHVETSSGVGAGSDGGVVCDGDGVDDRQAETEARSGALPV